MCFNCTSSVTALITAPSVVHDLSTVVLSSLRDSSVSRVSWNGKRASTISITTNDLTNSTPVKKNKLWVIESHRPRPGTATNNPGPDLYTVGGFDPARRPLYEARPPGAPGGTRDSPAGRPPPALRRAPPRSRRRLRGAGAAAGPARVASAARDRSPAVARYVPAEPTPGAACGCALERRSVAVTTPVDHAGARSPQPPTPGGRVPRGRGRAPRVSRRSCVS